MPRRIKIGLSNAERNNILRLGYYVKEFTDPALREFNYVSGDAFFQIGLSISIGENLASELFEGLFTLCVKRALYGDDGIAEGDILRIFEHLLHDLRGRRRP